MFKFKSKYKSIDKFSLVANFFIGHNVEAEGLIKTEDDIYIDGILKGEINTSGLVEIAKNAKVEASIKARTLIIEGQFKGEIRADQETVITKGAVVSAKLSSQAVGIEKGAIFNGQIKMPKLKHLR